MKMYRHKSAVLFPGLLALLFLTLGGVAFGQDVTEQNKELVRRIYEEVFTNGDVSVNEEIMSPDFVDHEEGAPEDMAEGIQMLHTAFPDFKATIDDMVAEGDTVAVRGTWSGTHEGDFMGIPATGNSFSIQIFDFMRIEDGLIVEHWGITDIASMMMQLGIEPPSE